MIPFPSEPYTVLKTILLIEKDENLREFFFRVFTIDGFEVLFLSSEDELSALKKDDVNRIDVLVIDDCPNPQVFDEQLKQLFSDYGRTRKLPVLGVLSKGVIADPYHDYFDAVMIKDNFNIQLLTNLIEKFATNQGWNIVIVILKYNIS